MGSPAPGAGGDGVGELFPPCSLGFLHALTLKHVHLSLRQWRLPEPAIRPLALRRPTPEIQYLTCPTGPVPAEDASRTQVGVGKKTNQRGRGDVDCWRVDGRWVVVCAPFGFQHALVLTDPLDGSFFSFFFIVVAEQESALETYLLEKRAAAFPPSSSQPTPNPSSAFQPSAGPSSLATPGLSSFSHTTHPLAQGLGPFSSSSSTSPSTTTAEATPQPGFINSHGGGNAAMPPSAVSTAPGSETPTPTMGTPVPVQAAGVTVGGGGEGGA